MFVAKAVVGLTICLPSLISVRAVDFPQSKLTLMPSAVHEFS